MSLHLNTLVSYNINDPEVRQYLVEDDYCSKYLDWIERNTGEVIINEENEEIVGYVFVGLEDDPGFIATLEVKEPYRGQGLGTALLDAAIDEYDARDLVVEQDNEIAINMYEKAGFQVVGDVESPDGNPAYYMQLEEVTE